MSDNYRMERIERLFHELRYEITRGMMEREIDESLWYRFVVPMSSTLPAGIVLCEFRARPVPQYALCIDDAHEPRLRVVK